MVLQMPCGSGKTELAMAMAAGVCARKGRTLFLAERITLVNQAASRFRNAGFRVGVIQANNPGYDIDAPVQIASLQTVSRRGLGFVPNFIVADECHVTYKATYQLLDSLPDVPVVGLSATPWSKGLGKHYDALVVGATTSELIERGYLVDAEVWGPAQPDMAGVRTVMTRYGRDFDEGETEERAMKIVGDVLENWLRYGENRQTAMFAVSIAHSKALTETFVRAGIPAVHVDAYTNAEDRESAFLGFTNRDYRIISSVDVLGRGWDEPAVSCVIAARPTRSLIVHVQQVGRGLRPAEGKQNCVLLDLAGNTQRLGFVTDPLPDTLDNGEKGERVDRKEPLPKPCPRCAFLKRSRSRICPKCGFVAEAQNKISHEDGELTRIRKGKMRDSVPEKAQVYGELRAYARGKGYQEGWAAHKYRTIYGVWPNLPQIRHAPEREPTQAVLNWLKSETIRWAKAQQKAAVSA